MWMSVLTACAVLGMVGPAQADGDPQAGMAKAAACAACHGADGNSVAPNFPNLAGQNPAYTVKQLRDYKSGARRSDIMGGMVTPLSDRDMEDLAAYFSGQPLKIGVTSEKSLSAGQRLYRGGDRATGAPACMACHSPSGAGDDAARFPRLSGQHADYVLTQLKAFRDGVRANDPNQMMRAIATRMTIDEMQAVAQYMVGLH